MNPIRTALLWVMGLFYVVAGVIHFIRPDFYQPMMPPYLPWHTALIYISGLAEIGCGVGVLLPETRRYAAWATIALLVAIFPANIHIAVNNIPVFGAAEGAGIWNWVRLPIQGFLILWAWIFTQDEPTDAHGLLSEFQSVFKPALLERLDEIFSSERLPEIVRDLRDDRVASLTDIGIRYGIITEAEREEHCLRQGWFDPEHGFWKDLPALEPIFRRSLLRAGETALRLKLPIESYWIVAGEGVRIATCKGKRQVTILFVTPTPPLAEGLRWPPQANDIAVFGADPKSGENPS